MKPFDFSTISLNFDWQYKRYFQYGNNSAYHSGTDDGYLSIKTMFNDLAYYEIGDGKRFAVDDAHYLILNQDQPYTITKEGPIPIESFCIFFPHGMAEDVLASLITPDDRLLDNPYADNDKIYFFEQLYPHDDAISPIMDELRSRFYANTMTEGWREDQQHRLLQQLLNVHRDVFRQAENMPAVRESTRLELYRRVHIARDYMHACFHESLSLDDIARVAALSPHHFLRTFKSVFGRTPHQYLTQKRLERAQFLLTKTDLPVTAICMDVGFESLGSFSTLFRKHIGHSPRQFRLQSTN